MMSNDLYFIPILSKAFDSPDREKALEKAFNVIQEKGREPGYETGFVQFECFMEEVAKQVRANQQEPGMGVSLLVDTLIAALATGTFEGDEFEEQAVLASVSAQPTWRKRLDSMRDQLRALEEEVPATAEITVTRDDEEIQTLSFPLFRGSHVLRNISPGRYCLVLGTGLVLCECVLAREDVEWAAAFPGRPLELAADTKGALGTPTREFHAMGGEITMRVFPGLETGVMRIDVGE